ncbi:MAG: hypothetical protein ABWU84_12610, partial [Pyrobaculum sp.]|uniref:hypothetical protein n=1 Tax=Pyrobaculum sp. TaxID=2004705 RepID=UPI003EEB7D75
VYFPLDVHVHCVGFLRIYHIGHPIKHLQFPELTSRLPVLYISGAKMRLSDKNRIIYYIF